jgi:hypothetical protein
MHLWRPGGYVTKSHLWDTHLFRICLWYYWTCYRVRYRANGVSWKLRGRSTLAVDIQFSVFSVGKTKWTSCSEIVQRFIVLQSILRLCLTLFCDPVRNGWAKIVVSDWILLTCRTAEVLIPGLFYWNCNGHYYEKCIYGGYERYFSILTCFMRVMLNMTFQET